MRPRDIPVGSIWRDHTDMDSAKHDRLVVGYDNPLATVCYVVTACVCRDNVAHRREWIGEGYSLSQFRTTFVRIR